MLLSFSELASLSSSLVLTMQEMSTNSTIHESLAGVSPTIHIKLDDSLGALLIGLIFASILFGIANVRTLVYYQNSANDPKYMKWMVMFLWLLSTFHLALISNAIYRYLVTDFGSLLAITRPDWSIRLQLLVSLLITCAISLVYAYRVWIMSNRNWVLTLGALTLILVEFVSGMLFVVKTFTFDSVFETTEINWLGYTSLGSAAASDLWCAVCLCYYLARDRTGFKTTDTKLNSLMLYIIRTGLLTSLCAICCLILFAAAPHGYSYIAIHFCLSKLYFSALLALFNSRNRLREGIRVPGRTSDQDAYQLPQIVNIHRQPSSEHEASFGTIQEKMPSSSYKE